MTIVLYVFLSLIVAGPLLMVSPLSISIRFDRSFSMLGYFVHPLVLKFGSGDGPSFIKIFNYFGNAETTDAKNHNSFRADEENPSSQSSSDSEWIKSSSKKNNADLSPVKPSMADFYGTDDDDEVITLKPLPKAGIDKSEIKGKSIFEKIKELKNWISFLRHYTNLYKKIFRWLLRIFRAMLRCVSMKIEYLDLTVGLGDVYYTGMFSAAIAPFIYDADESINVQPDFGGRAMFLGKGSLNIKTSLARLVSPICVAIFSFPYISAIMFWFSYRKKKQAEN